VLGSPVLIELDAGHLEKLRQGDDRRPFVLVQLLRFAEGGRDAYVRYSAAALPLLRPLGAQLLYAGQCVEPLGDASQAWEAIVVTRYPNRSAYLRMLDDPAFKAIAPQRRAAVRDAVYMIMDDWPGR
jgi:uncharacterized protein (DUF1330 family)